MNDTFAFTVRMKKYEDAHRMKLTPRCPKVIRIDGKAFSSYTSKLAPFNGIISNAMLHASQVLLAEIGGVARFAYTQSDESSIIMNDGLTLETQAWFDNNIQKIASVSASIFTAHFNQYVFAAKQTTENLHVPSFAYFDARVVQLPDVNELTNYLVWRQSDAVRNSIQQLAQSEFSQKELQGQSCVQLKETLVKHGNPWEELPPIFQHGGVVDKHNQFDVKFKDYRSFVTTKYFQEGDEESEASNPLLNVQSE